MTVQELIEALQQVENQNAKIWIFDSDCGYINITELFETDKGVHIA